MIGILVHCLNCETLWQRITPESNPGGTVATVDVQLVCPRCWSNAYKGVATKDRLLDSERAG